MKKILLSAVLLFSFSFLIAQDDADDATYPVKGDYEIGVYLGLFTSTVSDNGFGPTEDSEYLYSLGLGASFDYYFSKTWSIKTRLNFDPKGAEEASGVLKLNMNYLSIPVMASWHFGKRKRWYLHFGPYAAFLLSAELNGLDVKDQFNSSQIGFDLGIGVKIPVGKTMLFIETDGQNDYTSPLEDTDPDNEDNTLLRSTLSVGVIF